WGTLVESLIPAWSHAPGLKLAAPQWLSLGSLGELVHAYGGPPRAGHQIPRILPSLLLTLFFPIFTILLTWLFRRKQPGPPWRGALGRVRLGIPFHFRARQDAHWLCLFGRKGGLHLRVQSGTAVSLVSPAVR